MDKDSFPGPGNRPSFSKNDTSPGVNLWIILLAVLGAVLIWNILRPMTGQFTRISYTTFKNHLQEGIVASVTIQGDRVEGTLEKEAEKKTGQEQTQQYKKFVTFVPSFGDDNLLSLLQEQDVEITTLPEKESSMWWYVIISFLPFLLLIGLFYYQFKRLKGKGGPGGGLFSIGKSKAKLYDKSREKTTFDDVAGVEGAKKELEEIIAFLKEPERIKDLGGNVPKGVLLVGAPGTGKTLLARAVAGEADVPFYLITGSDFMEMFVGVGASRVRNLFQDAKKDAPSIIFIDELDSIGRHRGAGLGGGHDEREQTLNQLLSEMDGFEPHDDVIVMSATNRPDILDPALLRPGRFDRRVTVDMPNTKNRREILKIYARNKPLADDVDLEHLAKSTPGFSGADLENLLNEAALLAARKEKKTIEKKDIEEARDKVLMGLQRHGMALSDEDKRMVAYHEGGHSVVAAVLPKADPIHKVSIVPRTRSMGATQQLPEEEKYIYGKDYLLDRLGVMMGGRAAEELIFQTSTSGAGNDLTEATKLARKMVVEWGMSEKFKHMGLGSEQEEVFLGEQLAGQRQYSDETAREVDKEVQVILDQAYKRAEDALKENRDALDAIVDELVEQEEILGERVMEILGLNNKDS